MSLEGRHMSVCDISLMYDIRFVKLQEKNLRIQNWFGFILRWYCKYSEFSDKKGGKQWVG